MTNYNERLDEILDRFGNGVIEAYLIAPKSRATADLSLDSSLNEAQSALLDWRNKQVEEVLDRLLEHCEDFTTFGDGRRSVAVEYIEAERNKLKERDDDQL